MTKSPATQCALEQREDRVIVDDAVDEQDRGPGGDEIVVEQTALLWSQSADIVPEGADRAIAEEKENGSTPKGYSTRCAAAHPASTATPPAVRGRSCVITR